jgi:hypothetical protein
MAEYETDGVAPVTAEIQHHLSDWFGEGASLVTGFPKLRKLRRSFFLRYGVAKNAGRKQGC